MPCELIRTPWYVGRNLFQEFALLDKGPGAVWLDSVAQARGWGRQSLMAHFPFGELRLVGRQIFVRQGKLTSTRPATIHDALLELDRLTASPDTCAIGFISYEAMLPLLGLRAREESALPLLHFYLYHAIETIDHADEAHLAIVPPVSPPRAPVFRTLSRDDYVERILRIKRHIREGDIYQANFTCRFDIQSQRDPLDVYRYLRALSPSPYAAYLDFGDYQILSASPERMLYRDGDFLSTSPIKGTIHRGRNPQEDEKRTQHLLASGKDCAEHLMIVDLERNDLGQIARTGTVSVDRLSQPEEYGSVIHLVSDISARIVPDLPMSQIFSALLPGGSITGAPKRRAVEIIRDTEVVPRSVYTGCIGYIHGHRADFNLAIRTIIHHNGWYYVHAGGGIVADSDPDLEYQEMLLKASSMFRALGIPKDE